MFLPDFTTSAKSIFTMIGYIMKNRQIAMGIDTTGASFTWIAKPSSVVATSGANLPSSTPAAMHRSTQSVRKRSKKPSPFASSAVRVSDSTRDSPIQVLDAITVTQEQGKSKPPASSGSGGSTAA